jgi:hypothetical protein
VRKTAVRKRQAAETLDLRHCTLDLRHCTLTYAALVVNMPPPAGAPAAVSTRPRGIVGGPVCRKERVLVRRPRAPGTHTRLEQARVAGRR